MNFDQDIHGMVVLKPKKQNPLIIIFVITLLAILTYLRLEQVLHHPTNTSYWVRFAIWLVLVVFITGNFVYRIKSPQADVLKLTPAGLVKNKTLYRWHEIEQFGMTGAKKGTVSSLFTRQVVFWKFRESSRSFIHKSNRFFFGFDEGILARYYEIPAEDMVKMLNDWKIRYTGQSSEIEYQGVSGRTLTINPGQKKLVMLNLILVMSVAVYFSYGYFETKMILKNMRGAEWITIDTQDRLYFVYQGNVYRLNLKDDALEKLIETDEELSSGDIMGIAVNSSGNIFLTNPKTREVHIYSQSGEFVRKLEGHFKENAKIAVDDNGIYLADMQGNRVVAINPDIGNILWTDNKGYRFPDSLDVRDDIVYVSDKDTKSVRLLSTLDGHVIDNLKLDFSGYSYGSTLLSMHNHELLLAQTYSRNGRLQIYSDDGNLLKTISGPDGFSPVGLAVTSMGYIVVSNDGHYWFYSVEDGLVRPLQSVQLDKLFESNRSTKVSLEDSSLLSMRVMIFCIVWLIGILVYYKRATAYTSGK